MENIDYDSRIRNTLIRIETVLDHRIGEIYNNESLIMTNEFAKANCSIRLMLAKDYDIGTAGVMFHDNEDAFYPLEIRLTDAYNQVDYAFWESAEVKAIEDFINTDGSLNDEGRKGVFALFKDADAEAEEKASSFQSLPYEKIAYCYQKIMTSSSQYPLLPVLARLDIYTSLLCIDTRFSGCNFEEAMLIRREEHFQALSEADHKHLTLFLLECILDGITRASDQLDEMKSVSEYAVLYLSMKMEKGKAYTLDELSLLFSLDKEMVRNLFLIPALSSDRISVGVDSAGLDTITLIG